MAADEFTCAQPDVCLSATATWDEDVNVDLALILPDDDRVGPSPDQRAIGACSYDGDEDATMGSPPFDENITCSPPDQTGEYLVEVEDDELGNQFDAATAVMLNINKDGVVTCQEVMLDTTGPGALVRIPVTYP